MILSTRVNPPKPLNLTRPPLHTTNSAHRNPTLRHLLSLSSPLPSPSLPSILPRHGKKPPPLNTRRALRLLAYLTALVLLYWCLALAASSNTSNPEALLSQPEYVSANGLAYEIVAESELPDYALPVALTDRKGKAKWTVSIPAALGFPLAALDYADICTQAEDVARHVAELKDHGSSDAVRDYYYHDSNYLDVQEAQAAGLLPPHHQGVENDTIPICPRSLTYVLDATHAGLGPTLLGLWLAHSLAAHENRAFFIDDTHFAYGSYTDLFTPPPTPECRPPPHAQRVPCPHQARHLVISGATAEWAFGEAFNARFGRDEVFGMMRRGYEALWGISHEEDVQYVEGRLRELQVQAQAGLVVVSVHVRHGDVRPREFQYERSYIPLGSYVQAATDLGAGKGQVKMIIASDDPEVYTSPEFHAVERAQSAISLASKKSLGNKGVGWEGGFFRDVFWSVGRPEGVREVEVGGIGGPSPSKQPSKKKKQQQQHGGVELRDYRTQPTEEALVLRRLIARAYLMDLAVLGRSGSGGVVCGVGSAACRVLAVMMGMEGEEGRRLWRNVDGGWGVQEWWGVVE